MKTPMKLAAGAVSAVMVSAALVLGGSATGAVAVSGVPCYGTTPCTDTFSVTGAPEFWTVPAGVGTIQLVVAAGSGGDGRGNAGGAGGHVTAEVQLDPGDRLALMVGDQGHAGSTGVLPAYGGGGSLGNGDQYGGHGGGGSFVFLEVDGHWEPLLIAGGGGGGGRAVDEAAAGEHLGGNGGFSGSGADADGATSTHTAGATTTAAGYVGGHVASFDGSQFTPGKGQDGNDWSGGGGGYYGGAAAGAFFSSGAGGGSGYAANGVTVTHEEPHTGPGSISVTYDASNGSDLSLSVASGPHVVGQPIELTGVVTQYDTRGSEGGLSFMADFETYTYVTPRRQLTVDSGTGPFTGTGVNHFTPREPGTYRFWAYYQSTDHSHGNATSAYVTVEVFAAPVAPPPTQPAETVDELANTGASGSFGPFAAGGGALGALLLGAGAILIARLRYRTR